MKKQFERTRTTTYRHSNDNGSKGIVAIKGCRENSKMIPLTLVFGRCAVFERAKKS